MSPLAAGFFSYARQDDEREGGKVARIRDSIQAEFALLTGEELDIFIDHEGIQWGDPFRKKLAEALQETTFFIPVFTPTYFLRDECRKEMQKFVSSARELGLEELLLSIRYISVPDLKEDSTDELKAIGATMQFEDLSELRFEDESSGVYRKRINDLAVRLVDLTHALEQRPGSRSTGAAPDAKTSGPSSDTLQDDPEAPGLMDLLADLQPAAEAWQETMLALTPALAPLKEAFDEAAVEMTAAGSASNPFAARVLIARRLSEKIESSLLHIEEISKNYSATLLRIDPAIGAFIESAALSKSDEDNNDQEELAPAVKSLEDLIAGSREMATSASRAAMITGNTSKISRDLRPSLRRLQEAMRNISDGQELIDGWEKQMISLGLIEGA